MQRRKFSPEAIIAQIHLPALALLDRALASGVYTIPSFCFYRGAAFTKNPTVIWLFQPTNPKIYVSWMEETFARMFRYIETDLSGECALFVLQPEEMADLYREALAKGYARSRKWIKVQLLSENPTWSGYGPRRDPLGGCWNGAIA